MAIQQFRSKKLSLAVLISGTGRTLKNLLEHIEAGTLSAEVRVVIASTPHAKGLQYAEQASIPIHIVERQDYETRESFSEAIFRCCDEADVDNVILAGYIKLLEIPASYHNRVLNIHPSLIPAFSGKGYYGDHVHEAVLRYGAKVTGCTVHFVNNEYDRGPVILQRAIDVLEDDDVASLNQRVFEQERLAYPEAIQRLAEGKIKVEGNIVRVSQ
ncbi:MAG: phosphoribosylglycinamide formyltransferase [Planctomycetaceae bacterium]|jgi:formyltetrahydrofolate-dependent phosphoribosylglycinamide formyltransferase|nr:phosphoribosylglycinamide formyltransferase [Planctomycetaceae bacterium]